MCAYGCLCVCVCVHESMSILAEAAVCVQVLVVVLLQKDSMLGFVIRIQGSPLAPVISQTCPKAPKQGEREEGGQMGTQRRPCLTQVMQPEKWENEGDSKGLGLILVTSKKSGF